MQRGYHFAIVDEVDSILIDEARTPLIISGPATVSTHQYDKFKPLVEQLVKKQTMLCNRLVLRSRGALRSRSKTDEVGPMMVKVKLGQPRNKGLLRMMEDPERRRVIDKTELSYLRRYAQGGILRAEGRTVLHHGRARARGRPQRAGPRFHEPGRSGRVRAARSHHAICGDRHTRPASPMRRSSRKSKSARPFAITRASAFTISRSSCAPTASSRRTCSTWSRKARS